MKEFLLIVSIIVICGSFGYWVAGLFPFGWKRLVALLLGGALCGWLLSGIFGFWHTPQAKPVPVPAQTGYEPPDPCGLTVVVCPAEAATPITTEQDYEIQVNKDIKAQCDLYPKEPCMGLVTVDTSQVIDAIARIETDSGQTGVGKSKNNPAAIKCGKSYCSYPSYEDGLNAAMDIWQKYYADLPLDDALAKWKTGSTANRMPETVAYISLVGSLITP